MYAFGRADTRWRDEKDRLRKRDRGDHESREPEAKMKRQQGRMDHDGTSIPGFIFINFKQNFFKSIRSTLKESKKKKQSPFPMFISRRRGPRILISYNLLINSYNRYRYLPGLDDDYDLESNE